jgi:hypothetical protein
MAPEASRCDDASATIDTTNVTSKAARTRERRGAGRARLYSVLLQGCAIPRAGVFTGQRSRSGLIFGLIRLRSPTFIGVRSNVAMQVADVNGIWRTIIPISENRKVDDSIVRGRLSSLGLAHNYR